MHTTVLEKINPNWDSECRYLSDLSESNALHIHPHTLYEG